MISDQPFPGIAQERCAEQVPQPTVNSSRRGLTDYEVVNQIVKPLDKGSEVMIWDCYNFIIGTLGHLLKIGCIFKAFSD